MTIIDISHYQTVTNLGQLADAAEAIWHKVTQGTGFVDADYEHRRASLVDRVIFGGYHFASPDSSPGDPEAEADWFVAHLGRTTGRPMLDLESSALAASLTDDWALRFCARVDARLGLAAGHGTIIYAGPGWAQTHLEPNPALAARDLWVAHYTSAAAPTLPKPWTGYLLWQFTSSGTIAGIAGRVDTNRLGPGRVLGELRLGDAPAPPIPGPTPQPQPEETRTMLDDLEGLYQAFLGRPIEPGALKVRVNQIALSMATGHSYGEALSAQTDAIWSSPEAEKYRLDHPDGGWGL